MGWLDGIDQVVKSISDGVDKNFTSDEERLDAQYKLNKIQTTINLMNAKSRRFWDAGWRPCYGWGSAILFFVGGLYMTLIQPLLLSFGVNAPPINISFYKVIAEMGAAILGIYGTQRTIEKIKDKTS